MVCGLAMGKGDVDVRAQAIEARDALLKKRGGEKPALTREAFAEHAVCAQYYYLALGYLQLAAFFMEQGDFAAADAQLREAESSIMLGEACDALTSSLPDTPS
jgi:predicted negative regulator of RcsB-dependent stress response